MLSSTQQPLATPGWHALDSANHMPMFLHDLMHQACKGPLVDEEFSTLLILMYLGTSGASSSHPF